MWIQFYFKHKNLRNTQIYYGNNEMILFSDGKFPTTIGNFTSISPVVQQPNSAYQICGLA